MRKVLLGIIGGAALGALLVLLIIFIGSFQSVGSAGQHKDPSQTISGSDESTDSVLPSESEEPSETETSSEIESEFPTEPEWPTDLPTEPEPTTEPEQPTEEPDEPEPSEPDKPKEIPYYIKVNRAANCVTIYTKDADGNYTVPYKSMICSVGTYYWDIKTETVKGNTPLGTYKMPGQRYKWRLLFGPQGLDVYGHYTTRIVGHILFHSVPYTVKGTAPGTVKTLWEGQYNRLGSPASKGCIRLSVADSKWIYDNCGEGTIVEIYDDAANPGPLGRPEAIKIPDESPYAGWDPTDPDKNNPWHTGEVVLSGVQNLADLERGTMQNLSAYLLGNVTATDVDTLPLSVNVTTDLDQYKVGTYTITYTATGVTGKTASATATVKIVDTTAPNIVQKNTMTITVNSSNIEQMILAGLELYDNGEKIDASGIELDLSKLYKVMGGTKSQTVMCSATATDAYGNKSHTYSIVVLYKYEEDTLPPEIHVTESEVSTEVDLTDVTDEAIRRQTILEGAIAAVESKHYTVSDNVSATNKIVCQVTGTYEGATVAGEYQISLTITATDEKGNSSTAQIVVLLKVADNTVVSSETEEILNQ